MIIGVTGRAGSGKSFFESVIHQTTPAVCIDLDKVGHEVLELPDIQQRLTAQFGEHIRNENGINRKELGSIVFNDPEALTALNRLVHPKMKEIVLGRLSQNSDNDIMVFGALIHEIGLSEVCDVIVTVDADDEDIKRHSPRQFAIAQSQRSRESYIQEASCVITNTFDDSFLEKIRRLVKNNFRIDTTLDKIDPQED